MARIKKYSPEQKLSSFQTFILDENANSDYFRITEFKDTFTGGKNGFLIEGSEYLKESTEIKIELLDVNGDPIYYEPGNGIPEYYEGISKLIAVYIYEDTPIGLGKITILGELKEYDDNGVKRDIPEEWKGAYNVKWERTFQINKLLANEDRVRFYRRPKVAIDEIVKPIFSGNPPTIIQSGSVDGIPLVPTENTNLSKFSLPTSYRLRVNSGNNWTGSIEGQVLSFDNIDYTPTIDEVVNKTELVVSPPYSENNIVKSFTNEDYSITFPYIEGVGDLATALTGSFAKINITDMKTFVGDAARVKVFRRSQSQLTDFEFVQEIQLESNELLRDIETFDKIEELYGLFTDSIIDSYWITSSNDISVEFNQDFLYNSAKLSSTNSENFFTTESLSISSGVEYNLSFNVRKESNTSVDDYIEVFLSGSYNGTSKSQTITKVASSNSVLQKTNISENIVADDFDTARLYFEVVGDSWYINNVSLKAAQETAFSPDEITFIQQVPKTLPAETFDYRFEFYDINNNYIPVLVEETKTFDGGNLNLFEKSIELVPDQLYFAFDSASNPLPPTVINFEVNTTLVTGSVTFTSESYDFFGDFISASEYAGGGQYPGLLNDVNTDEPFLTVTNFTGSVLPDSRKVQFIKYTAEVEGVSDSVIITRVQDGQGGVNFEIRPFRGTIIKNKSDNDIELQALRIDGVNEITLKDNLPQEGFSDAKLRILSGSTYYTLSDAVDNNIIRGVSAGLTGSGEIDYNARFNRDAIDGELTVFLMDGDTETDILTSLKLTDLLDGLGSGFINFSAEQFSLQPRLDTSYNPITASVTASFQERGKENSFISGCLVVTPSASIDDDYVTHYYMFYETGAFDRRVTVNATDLLDNVIYSGIPGESVNFYTAPETKQLTLNFTYLEDITSASVSVDKTFYIVPEGRPGDDAIVVDIDPKIIQLSANQKGEVYTFAPMDTEISIKQGRLDLLYSDSEDAGTFDITNITARGINTGSISSYNEYSASITNFGDMPRDVLSGSLVYDLQIHPYFTSSFFTQSIVQKVTKAVDGADAIDVLINPIAINFSGDETGVITDTAAADTTINVKQGDEYLIFSSSGDPGTFTASFVSNNINILSISSSNTYETIGGDDTINFTDFGQMEYTTASVVYDITAYPYSLANGITSSFQRFRRTQLFSKANAGAVARSVKLTASTTTVNYDGDGSQIAPEGPVILTANAFGLTGSAYFQFLLDGFAYTLISTDDEFELGSGDTPPPGEISTWTVTLRDGSPGAGVVAQDSITIAGIKSGGDSYTVEVENNNVSVPFEVDGTGDFTGTGTTIRAYKGNTELTHVSSYSAESLDSEGNPIGSLGEFSSSLFSVSSYITQPNIPTGNPAQLGAITSWTNPTTNTQAEIVIKVDVENGRAVFFKTQSLAVSFEGEVGPGIVFRGEYTGSIDYQYSIANGRRDAVIYDKDGDGIAETYYIILQENGPGSTVVAPEDDPDSGDYWDELGTEDLFVAAEIGIFGESFVKNTINVGTPPPDNQNANIAIVGGTDEPYIAVGQSGTQGYAQQGVFIGLTNDGGPSGTSGTFGIMSLSGDPTDPSYRGLFWDGETLTIRGSIRQTAAGQVEPQLRGTWADATQYYINDSVIYNGQSWSANANHISTGSDATNGEPGFGTRWDASSGTGKTVSLSTNAFVIEYDQDGNNPSPSSINLIASSSNFLDPYFKFTGGGSFFTDETTFTDGVDTNNDSVSSIDLSSSTISDMPLQFRVGVSEGDQNEEVSDVINVFGVKPGADSTPMYFITSIAGGTQIKNSSGTIELQVQKSDSTGLSDITSGTDARIYDGATLLAAQTGVTDGGNGIAYNPIIASSFINGTKTLTLKDNGGDVLDTITLVDVSDGLGGGSFISPNLKSNRDTSTNAFTPTLLHATASFYDTSGTEYQGRVKILPSFSGGVDRMAVSSKVGDSEVVITATDGDGGVVTLGGSSVPTKDIVLTAVFTDPATSQTTTINETFYIVSDGVDGLDAITVINTNQAHTLPASDTGVVSSYTNSGTNIRVFEGTTELTYDGVGTSNGTWTVSTSQSPSSTITIGSITDNGDDITVGNHSAMANGTDSVTITYSISGTRSNGESFTSETTQTLTKAKAGSDGQDGQDGEGAGVVYRGEYDSGETYYDSANRRDVVRYAGSYYIANNQSKSGTSTWSTPPTDWESFGAEFSSVATDILFSQDVYANRTVNVGTDDGSPVIALNADSSSGYENPFIGIGQTTPGFLENGIYLGYAGGNPVLSFVSESTFFYYQSGSIELSDASFVGSGSIIEGSSIRVGRNLDVSATASNAYNFTVSSTGIMSASRAFISGSVNASDGRIGNWIIDPSSENGNGGVLRDNDSEIIFDPNIPELQFYSESALKVAVGPTALTSIESFQETFTWTSPEPELPEDSVTSGQSYLPANKTVYTGLSSNSFSVEVGTFEFTDIEQSQITVTKPTAVSPAGTNAYPNYSPSYEGEIHGDVFFDGNSRTRTARLYLEVVDTNNSNARIGSVLLGSATSISDFPIQSRYVAVNTGGFLSVVGTTKITLEDGTTKLAKDITLDDKILSWDSDTDKWVSAELSDIKKRIVSEVYKITIEDTIIEVSDNHGFWLFGNQKNSGQVSAKFLYERFEKGLDLSTNESKIWMKDGSTKKNVTIDKIEKIEREDEVITFSVPKYVNYLSNGIISHNYVQGLNWQIQDQNLDQTGFADTISGASGQTKNISISTATSAAKLRYRLDVSVWSGATIDVAANGSTSTNWFTQNTLQIGTGASGNSIYANGTMDTDGITLSKSNNFVELKPGGVQVVSSDQVYVKARRKDNLTNTTADDAIIFEVKGGSAIFEAAANPYTDAIQSDGHIKPIGSGVWDIGGTSAYWENGYFVHLNGGYFDTAIRNMVAGAVFTQATNNATPTIADDFNIASITRSGEGLYTVSLSNTSTFTLGDSYGFVMGYGKSGDTPSQTFGDDEFTNNWGIKVKTSNIEINSKDNDTNGDQDFYKAYFVLFSR